MAQVPTYDDFQSTPEALPDARVVDAQPGNSALQIGAAESQAGNDLAVSAVRMQRRENANALFTAEANLKDGYLKFQQQAQQRRGADAWGLTNDTANWWQQNTKTISDQLANPEQQELFAHSASQLREASLTQMSGYETGQQHQSIEDSSKASMQSSVSLAAASPMDDQVVGQAKADILKRTQIVANLNGYTPDMLQAATTANLTALHTQVIQSLVDKNPTAAQAYLDANKSEIDGSKIDDLDKLIKTGDVREQGQQASDKVMDMGLGELGSLKYVRDNLTGAVQDDATRRIKERYADVDMVRERDQKDAADQAYGIWSKTKSLSDVPTTVLSRMSGQSLDALQKQDAAHAAGKDVDTDWNTFTNLREMASQNPGGFAKTDLRQYFGSLGPAERKQMIDLQNQVKSPAASDVQTLDGQLRNAHGLLGWGPADGQRKGQFDSAVLTAIDAEQNQNNGGKKLAYDDRQKIVDRMMINGSYPGGSWFGSNKFYQVAGTDKADQFVPKIPSTEHDQIVGALQRAGRPVSEDAIMALYKRKNGL